MNSRPIAIGFTEGISALDELKQRVAAGHHDFAVMLAGGLALSRKTIRQTKTGWWHVLNDIDDTEQRLTDEQLWTESNIGEALDKRALLDMEGDEGLINIEGRGWVNEDRFLAEMRVQSGINTLPDEPLTDWYAGAWLKPTKEPVSNIHGWSAGDAVVAFTDIGWHESDGLSHGQVVVYVVDHVTGKTHACSAEVTPDDAVKIGRFLAKWGRKERKQ